MEDVRLRAIRVPGFGAHAQVNFRTYVRYGGEPGVWFLRELVPGRILAAVARWLYGEPFGAMRIRGEAQRTAAGDILRYDVGAAARGWRVRLRASGAPAVPPAGTAERHFTERVFGCRQRRGGLSEVAVYPPQLTDSSSTSPSP